MDRALPDMEGVEHRFVELPGLRMHVAEAGEGQPVMLVHGWFQHWWEWRKLIPGLAERYRVICPDLRGFGWSEAPSGRYEKEELAADLAALLDVLEVDRVHLVAHDWGAFIGFLLCLHHPERVDRYVALSAGPPFIAVKPRVLGTMWRFWYMQLIAAPGLGDRLVSGGKQALPRLLYRWTTVEDDAWSAEDAELPRAASRARSRTCEQCPVSHISIEGVPADLARAVQGHAASHADPLPTRRAGCRDPPGVRARLRAARRRYAP
jgi:pimeloyl-ACP methyl ester carboxylesterase